MANLNMNAQEGGRIIQAQEVQTSNNMGNRIARPIETQKAVHGMFGDASGDMAAADATMKTAQQINAVVQDGFTRLTNLQIAEEESKKQLYKQEWVTEEQQARSIAHEKAVTDGLDTDQQQQLYIDERTKRTGALKDKYSFMTKVGNDIEQHTNLWTNHADADYMDKVVIPRRVDNVKAGQIKVLDGFAVALSKNIAGEKDPTKLGSLVKETVDAVYNFTRTPQFIAIHGEAKAEEIARQRVEAIMVDGIAEMTTRDPEGTVKLLTNATGDPATDSFYSLDPSLRRQLTKFAHQEYSSRRAEAKAILKEKQDQNEGELTMGIVTGKISGNSGMKILYDKWKGGDIDQSHFERGVTKLQMESDRRERRALAAEERATRASEKRQAVLQPAIDAVQYGTTLDPRNPSHVKAANEYFAAKLKSDPKTDVAKLSAELGIVPKIFINTIRTKVMSTDPKTASEGTQLVAQLSVKVPAIAHQLPDDVITKATMINSGMPADQAHAVLQKGQSLTPEQSKVYDEKAKPQLQKAESELKKTFSGVKITPEAIGEWRVIYANQVKAHGGDVEAAKESTNLLMHKSHGVSYVTGKPTLMRNAPEGTNGETKWQKDDYQESLKSFNINPEETRLKWNPSINAYDIHHSNGAPAIDPVSKETLHWAPDQAAAVKKQRDAEEKEVQKKREEYLNPGPITQVFRDVQARGEKIMAEKKNKAQPVNTTEPKFGKF